MIWQNIIDDRGRTWDGRSSALIRRDNCCFGWASYHSFAVVNLGYVGTSEAPNHLHIGLRPDAVAPAALAAALYLLHEDVRERVAVSAFDAGSGWSTEIFSARRASWRSLYDRLKGSPKSLRSRYSRHALTQSRGGKLFKDLIDGWREAASTERLESMVRARPEVRYAVLERTRANGFRFKRIGNGMLSYAPRFQRIASEMTLSLLPDAQYARWISCSYDEALGRGEPLMERVSAVIDWPSNGTVLHDYERLVLPVMRSGDREELLTVSLVC